MECGHLRQSRTEFHYNQPPPMARLILTAVVSLLFAGVAAGADRPNIIFIMTDDHAAHAISAYGSRVNKTPHLDRIAREGALFENVFATNSICTPSRAAILTGQVLAHQRRDGLQPVRQQPHDGRAAAAAARLLHRHGRQVAPRERSRRASIAGKSFRDRALISIRCSTRRRERRPTPAVMRPTSSPSSRSTSSPSGRGTSRFS